MDFMFGMISFINYTDTNVMKFFVFYGGLVIGEERLGFAALCALLCVFSMHCLVVYRFNLFVLFFKR